MKSVRSLPMYLSVALILGLFCSVAGATPLDNYVTAPDANYSVSLAGSVAGAGYTVYVLDLTSQEWRSAGEVDRTIWEHWVIVVVPDVIEHDTGMLVIGGSSNNSTPPSSVDAEIIQFALETKTVVAELKYVPNQPLTFAVGGPRKEDDLIAYTWDKWLRGGDDEWPARMPMTKSAVAAMDAIQDSSAILGTTVNKFVVAGASKRGWTTWTTAAVDSRVVAFMPMVIDLLNVVPSFEHHYSVYGYWADAIDDYVNQGIMDWMNTEKFQDLMDIVDPYAYLNRYTDKPKMIVNSTGDEFFLPDSSQFYFDDLPGEKYLRYVPNTNHGLNAEAVFNMVAFYKAFLNDTPRPEFTWDLVREGKLKVMPTTPPSQVLLWTATNPTERNFRLDTIGSAWSSTPLTANVMGEYIAEVDAPATGWTAYFVELAFDTGDGNPMKFTTSVYVTTQRFNRITIDGDFSDWANVGSYYDIAGDTHDTDHELEDDYPAPVDHPDTDLLEYKFAHDEENLYAYFRATGEIGRTQTAAAGKAGRYYVIVTIDVDNDDSTGYPLHEGGYFPTTPGYDMNMEVEYYGGAFNTGHYLNHGCLSEDFRDNVAWEDQKLGLVDVRPGTYDYYTQWVWWDAGTAPAPTPPDIIYTLPSGDHIVAVEDKGPVYQGIIEIELSPDSREAEMVAPFRGFMLDKNNPDKPIMALGKTIDISFSLEASGELAPGLEWASDTGEPINGYYLSCEFPHNDDDGDGLENGEELDLGTDKDEPDTDGDTFDDGDEVAVGTDPLDPQDNLLREIVFLDPGLDDAVRAAISKPSGQLHLMDVLGVGFTELNASGRNINNLSGLENCRDLTRLELQDNNLIALSQLAELYMLSYINLSNNLLQDVPALLDNHRLGAGDEIALDDNPLTQLALCTTVQTLEMRGITMSYDGGCVIDDVAPVITILGDAEVFLNLNDVYVDAGATAEDDVDGDITAQIVTTNPVDTSFVGTFQVSYRVSDRFENEAIPGIRVVHVLDPVPPVLTLLGDAELTVDYGSVYVDAGVSVSDNYDTDLSGNVVVDNPVNTSVTGDYTITYNVSDNSGNPAVPVTRLVHVDEAPPEGEGEGEEIPEETLAQDLLDAFEDADTNKDNKLSYLEARAVMPDLSYERFQDLDKNGDGFLSEDELEGIINPPVECGCGDVKSFSSFKEWVENGLSDLFVFGLLLFSFNAWGSTRRKKKD